MATGIDLNWVVMTLFAIFFALTAFLGKRALASIDDTMKEFRGMLVEIRCQIVGKELCRMKHVAVDRELARHERSISRLFSINRNEMNGVEDFDDREEEKR
jgi:GTP-sensing pleiotropic transcriptional regulator CodY